MFGVRPPIKGICGVYHCANFGNQRSSFDNMQVLIFNQFGLKMPIHASKWVVWRSDSLNEKQQHHDPQASTCAETHHMTYRLSRSVNSSPFHPILCFTMLFNRPNTQKCPFPWGRLHPYQIHGSLDPPNSAFQTASRSVQPFLHISCTESLCFITGHHFSPSKLPLAWRELDPIIWFLGTSAAKVLPILQGDIKKLEKNSKKSY